MTELEKQIDIERLSLSPDQAETQFQAWRDKTLDKATIEQIKQIPHALLCSSDIIQTVRATGMISPFYEGGGRKSRLKKASYEGRIGNKAYEYRSLKRIKAFRREFDIPFVKDKYELAEIFDSAKYPGLIIPKNSIVFVETDLEFRVPDFIALRFNLQIKHVHRGL